MAHSVKVWERIQKHLNTMQWDICTSPEVMHKDISSIYEQQKAIGYESVFIEGEKDCTKYMKGIFDDWQAQGITSVLHEKKGGYAFNKDSIKALENKANSNGVNVHKGVKVTGFKRGSNSNAVTGVVALTKEQLNVICCSRSRSMGKDFWNMLELPKTTEIKGQDGKLHEVEMWK